MRKIISGILVAVGSLLLVSVLGPLLTSQLSAEMIAPLALIDPTDVTVRAASTADDTQASTWFTGQPPSGKTFTESKITYYTLSIPAVNLFDVSVEINGTNLDKNAIQYPGTALPGDFGNTVIFGHDTLPQLYRPGNPLSIFNPVVNVKVGDEVIINYDGVTYRYIVRNLAEVKPTQIEVLAQDFSAHELTIITCTPLGTFFHRFVVRAELVN